MDTFADGFPLGMEMNETITISVNEKRRTIRKAEKHPCRHLCDPTFSISLTTSNPAQKLHVSHPTKASKIYMSGNN
jgi:hypothetical protein